MTAAEIAVFLRNLWTGYIGPVIEIFLILLVVYALLYFFRRTRAISVLWGVIVILLGLGFLAGALKLEVFQWLLVNLWQLLTVALIVIFQPELRRAFAQLGSMFTPHTHARQIEQKEAIEEISSASPKTSL